MPGDATPRALDGARDHTLAPADGEGGAASDLIVLRAPSANRVYTDAAGALMAAEATRVLRAHLGPDVRVEEVSAGGADGLRIVADAPLERTAGIAARLSGAWGLFERREVGGDILLAPLDVPDPHRHPSDLETTLRYPGKTNEQFTALLIGLAAAASGRRTRLLDGTLVLLDPMCGRGTTLNRALRLGLSPVGADIDKADAEAYRAFLTTCMRAHQLKHTTSTGRLTVRGTVLGSRFDAELARDKAEQKAGRGQTVTMLRCDTAALGDVLAKGSADVIVTDLPYGVQHGAHGGEGIRRSPLDVLERALPVWRRLLRRDGAMALAINRRTASFDRSAAVLADAGFTVLSRDGEFRHRVDQSIERDVLLAVRDDHPELPSPRAAAGDEHDDAAAHERPSTRKDAQP